MSNFSRQAAAARLEDKVMAATPREVNRASGSLQLAL
jgi:hypothetical protein